MCDWELPNDRHVRWAGLDIHIDVPKGGTRKAKDGSWKVENMPVHYGYFRSTKGADNEPLDVYLGGHPEDGVAWVIDQVDAKTGEFDEHKVMAGFPSREDAVKAYSHSFSDGKAAARLGTITPVHISELKHWAKSRGTKIPFAEQHAAVARGENLQGFAA